MKQVNINIIIGNLSFSFVNELEVKNAWEDLVSTCSIKLPASLNLDRNKLRELIHPGDKVIVKAGYDETLNNIFSGYITSISPSIPIDFKAEDETWKLKQSVISDTIKSCTVGVLLKKHFSEYQTSYYDFSLGNFRIDKQSKAKVLQRLKDVGLHSFFRSGVLVVGKPYDTSFAKSIRFDLSGSKCNVLSEKLEFKRKEDVKLQVTAVSLYPDGKRKEVKLGDQGGETRTLNYYNLSIDELKAAAKRDLDRLIYDGYRGSFTASFEPFIRMGDIVELYHPDETDRSGFFWVDKVEYKLSTDGLRQEITLGPKAK